MESNQIYIFCKVKTLITTVAVIILPNVSVTFYVIVYFIFVLEQVSTPMGVDFFLFTTRLPNEFSSFAYSPPRHVVKVVKRGLDWICPHHIYDI